MMRMTMMRAEILLHYQVDQSLDGAPWHFQVSSIAQR
jgi:hypothetical protein